MHNINNPEFKKNYTFENNKQMNNFTSSINKNPMIKSVEQTSKYSVEVTARTEDSLPNLKEMYDTTPVDPKKKKQEIENPLAGKGYPYNEEKVECPKCKGDGCDHCDEKGYHIESVELDEDYKVTYKFAGDPDGLIGANAVGSQTSRTGLLKSGQKVKGKKDVFNLVFDNERDYKKFKRKYMGGPVKESVELDEAKTVTLVAKKGKKTVETVKKVTPKERKTVEMLLKSAHGKDIKIEVVKEGRLEEFKGKVDVGWREREQKKYDATYGGDAGKRREREAEERRKKKMAKIRSDERDIKDRKRREVERGREAERKRREAKSRSEGVELGEGDGVMIRELGLYITNNGDMYRQRIQPIIKNMRRKMAKGVYDEKLAAKGFMHAVTDGIKRYNKEFGAGSMKLSKSEKEEVASILLRDYQDEIREGVNYDTDASALIKKKFFAAD